jgi:hypothetical protein
MTHEEFRRFGTALDERVRSQVDTSERLDLLIRARRRSRVVAIAFATVAVVAVFLAAFLIREATGDPPVITALPTTFPEESGLTPLPVEVFVVLRDHYAADPATGACAGTGPLAGFEEGAQLQMRDESSSAAHTSVVLPGGQEITAQDERAPFLLRDGLLGCVFVVPDPGFSIAQYENVSISSDTDSGVASGMSISGQRVVFSFGEDPQYVEGAISPGVAPEDPADLLAELDELRASAGPGFLVGFVNVDSSQSTGGPPSPTQPLCVGVGQFGTIRPGEPILITSPDGFAIGETILHGAAFDAHLGCIYWFGVEVPADLGEYRVGVAGMGTVAFGSSLLNEHSWIVNLWTDQIHMQANCLDLEPDAEPMTCVLLEPFQ